MRIRAIALAVVLAGSALLAFAPLGVQAAVPTLESMDIQRVTEPAGPAAGFALAAAETVVSFTATADNTGSVDPHAELVLTKVCGSPGCYEVRRSMQRSGDDWQADLSSKDDDVLVGTYAVAVQFNAGSDVAVRPTNRTFTVTSSDSKAPTLELVGGGTRADIGPGEVVRVSASDPLLWRVTYQIEGLPQETLLAAPYQLAGDAFAQGISHVTFRAYDRALHMQSLLVTILHDTVAPQLAVAAANVTYLGVPLQVAVGVTDDSNVTLTLVAPDAVNQTEVAVVGPNGTHMFKLDAMHAGNTTFLVRAVDQVGLSTDAVLPFEVRQPTTDIELTSFVADPPDPLLGQSVVLKATVRQIDGVVPVDVNVTIGNATHIGRLGLSNSSVAQDTLRLGLGVHSVNATAAVLGDIPEVNATNQAASVSFEVFLGRVVNGTQSYDIRANDRGFAMEAVGKDGTIYPLHLEEAGSGVVYAFNVSGVDLHWDPLRQVTDLTPPAKTSSSTAPVVADKKSPGAGPLVALLVVALAAVAQRRRL